MKAFLAQVLLLLVPVAFWLGGLSMFYVCIQQGLHDERRQAEGVATYATVVKVEVIPAVWDEGPARLGTLVFRDEKSRVYEYHNNLTASDQVGDTLAIHYDKADPRYFHPDCELGAAFLAGLSMLLTFTLGGAVLLWSAGLHPALFLAGSLGFVALLNRWLPDSPGRVPAALKEPQPASTSL
jgi:hypothetical protein